MRVNTITNVNYNKMNARLRQSSERSTETMEASEVNFKGGKNVKIANYVKRVGIVAAAFLLKPFSLTGVCVDPCPTSDPLKKLKELWKFSGEDFKTQKESNKNN